jgi:ABC-type glycerol-3-phosphate transport system substrate-binding protein
VKNILRTAAIAAIAALALTACGSAPTTSPTAGATTPGAVETGSTPSAAAANFKACIVSDAGGFDDKSFNQLSYEGVLQATKDLGAQFAKAQSNAATDYAPNLQAMASENCNLIFAVGFNLSADTVTAALANPSIHYALIDDAAANNQDGKTDAPNINYGLAEIPAGTRKATYGVTDSLMLFKDGKHNKLAWQFLDETAFSPKWRIEFSTNEGFLPVTKAEAAAPVFTNDPQLKAFTDMLPYAHFAPPIPNWEQAADATIRALQQVYTKQAMPEAALHEAASSVDSVIQQ